MRARVWPENVCVVLTPPRPGEVNTVSSIWHRENKEIYLYIHYIYQRSEGFVCLVYFPAPRLAVWLQAADPVQFTAPARSDRGDAGGGGGDAGRGEGGGLVSPDSTSVLPSGHAQVKEHTHTHTSMWRMMRVGRGRADTEAAMLWQISGFLGGT